MSYNFPPQAKPNEVAILRIYLFEEKRPTRIAKLLHYRYPDPVYRAIRKFRDFLVEERKRAAGNAVVR